MKYPSWLQKNIIGFGLTSLFNDFSHEMTTAILPAFIEQLVGIPRAPLFVGLISGLADAIASIIRVWSGLIADRLKRYKLFLIIGYAATPLGGGLIGTAYSLWQVLLYRTFAWAGKGLREPMRDTWITTIIAPAYYGHAFGFVRALDTVGAIAGPLVAFFALPYYSLRTIFFISCIPGALSVLALIVLTHEKQLTLTIRERISFIKQYKALPAHFKYFVIIMFIFGIGNFNKLLIIYRAQELLTGDASSSLIATGWAILLYTLFNIVRAVGEYGIGSLSDYYNRKNLLAVLGFGLFGVVNLALIIPHTNLITWLFIFIAAGISAGTISALERAYAAHVLPEPVRGTGFGLLQMTDGIGDLLSSILVGGLWSFVGPSYGFLYATCLSILAMILLLVNGQSTSLDKPIDYNNTSP